MTTGMPPIAQGEGGELRVAGLRAGRLGAWRIVTSPTTGKPTLFGEGAFARLYVGAVGARATVSLTPAPTPARIGRPKPGTPKPFTLRGKIAELTAKSVTIAEGEIIR